MQKYPAINLFLNGKQIGEFYLKGNQEEFVFTAQERVPIQFSLEFHNDAIIENEDRNVFLKAIFVVLFAEK
jgi:hypothetical protein